MRCMCQQEQQAEQNYKAVSRADLASPDFCFCYFQLLLERTENPTVVLVFILVASNQIELTRKMKIVFCIIG